MIGTYFWLLTGTVLLNIHTYWMNAPTAENLVRDVKTVFPDENTRLEWYEERARELGITMEKERVGKMLG